MISELIGEGNKEGIFHSDYPDEAAEMIMIYANTAFDSLAGRTEEHYQRGDGESQHQNYGPRCKQELGSAQHKAISPNSNGVMKPVVEPIAP